jgi:hypothetical protein
MDEVIPYMRKKEKEKEKESLRCWKIIDFLSGLVNAK